MNDLSSLSALLAHVPEHPVPHAGDAVRLDYAPDPRGVAVSVRAAADGTATLTVTAPADEVERSVSAAQAAIVRSHGGDPRDAQAFEQALSRWKTNGYVLQRDAAILGVPAGTPTSDVSYQNASLALQKWKAGYWY